MPAMTVTVKSKSKDGLKRQVSKRLKELRKKGMEYVTRGFDEKHIRKTKDGYEIDIAVHS